MNDKQDKQHARALESSGDTGNAQVKVFWEAFNRDPDVAISAATLIGIEAIRPALTAEHQKEIKRLQDECKQYAAESNKLKAESERSKVSMRGDASKQEADKLRARVAKLEMILRNYLIEFTAKRITATGGTNFDSAQWIAKQCRAMITSSPEKSAT